jgi:four helix bundle protein
MRNFKELKVWSAAYQLTLSLYQATQQFPKQELFGLTSQIRRCSSSIGANLAEGCGRQGDGEMGRFIQIAMGSASELEYHLLLARDLKFLATPEHETLQSSLTGIRKMLASLLQVIIESKEKRIPRSKITAKS